MRTGTDICAPIRGFRLRALCSGKSRGSAALSEVTIGSPVAATLPLIDSPRRIRSADVVSSAPGVTATRTRNSPSTSRKLASP